MKYRSRYAVLGLCVFSLLLVFTQAHAADEATTTFDRWYVLKMSGEHAGYVHATERRKGDKIITQTDTKISIKRGPQTVTMQFDMWFVETADGQPVEASSTLIPGAGKVVTHLIFNDDGVEMTTGQGDAAHTTTRPPRRNG